MIKSWWISDRAAEKSVGGGPGPDPTAGSGGGQHSHGGISGLGRMLLKFCCSCFIWKE